MRAIKRHRPLARPIGPLPQGVDLLHLAERARYVVNGWLQSALARGAVGAPWEGDFPRYVWFKEGNVVYEARLVNSVTGEYKGYELEPNEWPKGIESYYESTD